MESTPVALPIAKSNLSNIAGSAGSTVLNQQGAHSSTSWAQIIKQLQGLEGHHHHGGMAPTGLNKVQSSTDSGSDAFGVAASSSDTSVDAFGTPSTTPSSNAQLVAAISDPFSSIASNFSIQAQLNSPEILDL